MVAYWEMGLELHSQLWSKAPWPGSWHREQKTNDWRGDPTAGSVPPSGNLTDYRNGNATEACWQ